MLSSAKVGTSSWRYYTEGVACRASEYYAGVGEAPGRWHGRGLEQLNADYEELLVRTLSSAQRSGWSRGRCLKAGLLRQYRRELKGT